jgi:hypothetical protein
MTTSVGRIRVAHEGWGVPDSHRAAFDLLAEHGGLLAIWRAS